MAKKYTPVGTRRLVRANDVAYLLNISKSTLWRWCRARSFPQPMRLSERSIAWELSEVETWVNTKKKEII